MQGSGNVVSDERVQHDEDELEQLNSPDDYQWRCPCMGMPCHNERFDRIQELILHMQREHALSIV